MTGRLLVGLVLAGCTDAPLSSMGHMTEGWIAAIPDPTTTTTAAPPATVGLLLTHEEKTVEWVNDELGDPLSAIPQDVVAAVWARSNKQDRYVQASRSEMAVALPGLEFPELIPEDVAFVTSQLVFDPTTGKLSADAAAAFGLWSVKPYSKSRSVAQLAVLMVAAAEMPSEPFVVDNVPEDENGDTRCEDLAGSTVEECTPLTLSDGCPAWSLNVTDGWRLVWSERSYEYDLFVRGTDNADLLARMAGSCGELPPVIPLLAGADLAGAPAEGGTDEPVEAASP